MKYIRYHEMENLIKIYPDLEGAIQSLKLELRESMKGADNDDLANLALKHNTLEEAIPHTGGYISDKTSNIAISYENKFKHEQSTLQQQLMNELVILELIRDKLDVGFKILLPVEKEILIDKYQNKLDWNAIKDKHLISKSTGCKMRREAVEKMGRIARITIKLYGEALKMLDLQVVKK